MEKPSRSFKPFLDQANLIHICPQTLVILSGTSGSGKSSFASRNFPETFIVSSDRCRGLICDNVRSLAVNEDAFWLAHNITRLRLKLGRPTVFDSTALKPFSRQPLLAMAQSFGYQTLLLLFDIPPAISQNRDGNRTNPPPVGPGVIAEQYANFQQTLKEVWNEGYDKILVIKPDQQDLLRVQIEV